MSVFNAVDVIGALCREVLAILIIFWVPVIDVSGVIAIALVKE